MSPPCRFQDVWLNAEIHPKFANWVRKVPGNATAALCSLCGKTLKLSTMGQQALVIHMEGAVQKKASAALNKTPTICSMFASSTQQQESPAPESADNNQVTPAAASGDMPINMTDFTIPRDTIKAEVLWCLKMSTAHMSYRSTVGIGEVFREMFPDSEIAKGFSLGRDKAAYNIVYGLAPAFRRQLERNLGKCDSVVMFFDEALNRVSQRCQMDIIVRFWDVTDNRVHNRYLTSVFMGRTRATDLAESFKSGLGNIPVSKIQQVSMDGPSVNWKCYKDMKDELDITGGQPTFLDAGSCGLHVVNGAFQTGHSVTVWDINSFLRALYSLFKDCPARRAEYIFINGSNLFGHKFCQIRWTENSKVTKRALCMLVHLAKWVKVLKPAPQTATFRKVRDAVADKLLPAKLQFILSLSELLEPFLPEFQTPSPMFPMLYEHLEQLLRLLMGRVVKDGVMATSTTVSKMSKVDLSRNGDSLRAKPDIGFGAAKNLGESGASDLDKLRFYKGCRDFYVRLVEKLLERSPVIYNVVKYASFFSPKLLKNNATLCQSRMQGLLEILVSANRITSGDAEKVKSQFRQLCNNGDVMGIVRAYKMKGNRLDDLYSGIFGGLEDYDELSTVCKTVLIMSHGNASVEGGFSVNADILIENTLVAQRVVYDHVQSVGGALQVDLSPELLKSVRLSRSTYRAALEAKRSDSAKQDSEAAISRKRIALKISELEHKRRAVVRCVEE